MSGDVLPGGIPPYHELRTSQLRTSHWITGGER